MIDCVKYLFQPNLLRSIIPLDVLRGKSLTNPIAVFNFEPNHSTGFQ